MNTIDLKLSLSQFQSLKVLLLYVLDNEHESYDEYIEENGTEFDDHIIFNHFFFFGRLTFSVATLAMSPI